MFTSMSAPRMYGMWRRHRVDYSCTHSSVHSWHNCPKNGRVSRGRRCEYLPDRSPSHKKPCCVLSLGAGPTICRTTQKCVPPHVRNDLNGRTAAGQQTHSKKGCRGIILCTHKTRGVNLGRSVECVCVCFESGVN
jgi:hypothetical protein